MLKINIVTKSTLELKTDIGQHWTNQPNIGTIISNGLSTYKMMATEFNMIIFGTICVHLTELNFLYIKNYIWPNNKKKSRVNYNQKKYPPPYNGRIEMHVGP